MARANYFSTKDKESKGGSQSGVLTGGLTGGSEGGSKAVGSGFTNLQKYLDANRGTSSQVADRLAADVGSQVQDFNTQLGQATGQGIANAQALDTSYGQDITADSLQRLEAEPETVFQADYSPLQGLDEQRASILAGSDQLVGDRSARQDAIQRLYGSGRGSGFGALDSFLVGADTSSGLGDKLAQQTSGIGSVGTSRDEINRAYSTATQQARENRNDAFNAARGRIEAEKQSAPAPTPSGPFAQTGGITGQTTAVDQTSPFAGSGGFSGQNTSIDMSSPFAQSGGITGSIGPAMAEDTNASWKRLFGGKI